MVVQMPVGNLGMKCALWSRAILGFWWFACAGSMHFLALALMRLQLSAFDLSYQQDRVQHGAVCAVQVPFSLVFTKTDKRKKKCPSPRENMQTFQVRPCSLPVSCSYLPGVLETGHLQSAVEGPSQLGDRAVMICLGGWHRRRC